MPELQDVRRHFNEGRTYSIGKLMEHFECDPVDVLKHLTRRNGFVERVDGKTRVWDFNPILADVTSLEAASNA